MSKFIDNRITLRHLIDLNNFVTEANLKSGGTMNIADVELTKQSNGRIILLIKHQQSNGRIILLIKHRKHNFRCNVISGYKISSWLKFEPEPLYRFQFSIFLYFLPHLG